MNHNGYHVFVMPANKYYPEPRYGVRFGIRSDRNPRSNFIVNCSRYLEGVRYIKNSGLKWAGHLGGNDRIRAWATKHPRPWWFLEQYSDDNPAKAEVLEIITRDQLCPTKAQLLWKAADHLEYLARISGRLQPDKIVVDLIGGRVKIVAYSEMATYRATPAKP